MGTIVHRLSPRSHSTALATLPRLAHRRHSRVVPQAVVAGILRHRATGPLLVGPPMARPPVVHRTGHLLAALDMGTPRRMDLRTADLPEDPRTVPHRAVSTVALRSSLAARLVDRHMVVMARLRLLPLVKGDGVVRRPGGE